MKCYQQQKISSTVAIEMRNIWLWLNALLFQNYSYFFLQLIIPIIPA